MKHSDYNYSSLDNDLAIIKFKDSVNLTRYVQLACIPQREDLAYESQYLAYDTLGFTLGFADFYSETYYMQKILADFPVNLFSLANCTGFFPTTNHTEQLICAGLFVFSLSFYFICKSTIFRKCIFL